MFYKVTSFRVHSSSLIEVIVAMLLASIIFTFSFAIIFNVTGESKLISKSYYSLVASSSLERLKLNYLKVLPEENEKWNELNILKRVYDYPGLRGLKLLEVRVFVSQDKEVAVSKCLMRDIVNLEDSLLDDLK